MEGARGLCRGNRGAGMRKYMFKARCAVACNSGTARASARTITSAACGCEGMYCARLRMCGRDRGSNICDFALARVRDRGCVALPAAGRVSYRDSAFNFEGDDVSSRMCPTFGPHARETSRARAHARSRTRTLSRPHMPRVTRADARNTLPESDSTCGRMRCGECNCACVRRTTAVRATACAAVGASAYATVRA